MSLAPQLPFETVFFDCDSTLSALEGIDELARRKGVDQELIPLTEAAMDGRMPLEEVYRRRLDVIRPDSEIIRWLQQRYLETMVEGSDEVVSVLHALGKQVHIVSGGIRQAVVAVGEMLEIPANRIHAVDVNFDESGDYSGFDESSPLARAGGKADICRRVLEKGQSAVLVGDGVTDLEAASAGVFVVGFGGVAQREAVKRGASVYINGPSLCDVLDAILTEAEREHLLDR